MLDLTDSQRFCLNWRFLMDFPTGEGWCLRDLSDMQEFTVNRQLTYNITLSSVAKCNYRSTTHSPTISSCNLSKTRDLSLALLSAVHPQKCLRLPLVKFGPKLRLSRLTGCCLWLDRPSGGYSVVADRPGHPAWHSNFRHQHGSQ